MKPYTRVLAMITAITAALAISAPALAAPGDDSTFSRKVGFGRGAKEPPRLVEFGSAWDEPKGPVAIRSAEARTAVTDALTKTTGDTVTVPLAGHKATLSPSVANEIAVVARNAGKSAVIRVEVIDDGSPALYMVMSPTALTKTIRLDAELTTDSAKKLKSTVEARYGRGITVAVIRFAQSGNFGHTMQVGALLDLTGIDGKNLKFYSYSSSTKTCTPLQLDYQLDDDGFIWFNTSTAGNIVVTDASL